MLRWSFLISIAFILGCKPSIQIANDNYLLFSIEKGPCFGTCPEYKVEVFSNGDARLSGIRNVEHIGEFQTKLSAEFIKEINSLCDISVRNNAPHKIIKAKID